jgi:cobyrinic acid a,c-diamide synthase
MFHREAIGVPSRNLDPFFSSADELRAAFRADADVGVAEGVMGYYDGIGADGRASTYDVAAATDTPVVLIVSVRGMYTSAGAILRGFKGYREDSRIAGVIFNHCSDALYTGLRELALREGVAPLGYMPPDPQPAIESRHLGLITPSELSDVQARLRRLGELAESSLELDAMLSLAAQTAPASPAAAATPVAKNAVARDPAFCFTYRENLELLEELGAELCYFSPLNDESLPPGVQGLYLCGGYPELYAAKLSANAPMLSAVRDAITGGLPTIAECGGFLYLHRTLDGVPMVGAIDADAFRTPKLQRFGYVTLTAQRDNLLCESGDSIRSHEFHYFDSSDNGDAFRADKPYSSRNWRCIHATSTLYAGFPHLYLPANRRFAVNFLRKATKSVG